MSGAQPSHRAVVCRSAGGWKALKVETVPTPRPGAGEVLLDVRACSLNYPDSLISRGQYQFKPPVRIPRASRAGFRA